MASIDVGRRGDVSVVTLQNAARMNSFDPSFLAALRQTMGDQLQDEMVRAIVLTGEDKVFCAGADIGAFQAAIAAGTATEFVLAATEDLHPMLEAVHDAAKPVVAAVNGVAAGGGLGLALAADARLGSPEARFAAAYFGIGVSPDGGSTWLLPRVIGEARARRFFFDNEVMDADTALAAGLLDRIVPATDLVDEAVALAARWGRWARHSRHATKRLLASQSTASFHAQLEAERGLIAAAAGTADFREGIAAFVEKRQPEF